jgi:type VI secretion system secreted protein Hcp
VASSSFAQFGGDAYLSIRAGDGSVRTAKLDPQGSCTIDNIKPGTYGVALLVPAVQKVREAATRSSTGGTTAAHEKWIEIESWSWGTSNSTAGHGGGGGAGKVSVHDISVSTKSDKSTPKLAEAVAKGNVSPARAQLNQKTTHNGQEYYEIKLKDILISGYSASSGGDRPTESLSLNFTKIRFKYDLKENVK